MTVVALWLPGLGTAVEHVVCVRVMVRQGWSGGGDEQQRQASRVVVGRRTCWW